MAVNQLMIVPEGSKQAAVADDEASHITPSITVLQKSKESSANGGTTGAGRSRRSSVDSGVGIPFDMNC